MSEWRETDIGLVPHDWNVVRFKELLQIPLKNGVNKPSRVRGIGDYKMVNMNEIFAHDVIKDIPMEFVELNDNEQSTSLLEKNDLLFARQSLVFEGAGKCSIYTGNNEKVCFEGHLIRARINSKKSNPEFYYYFFSSSYGKRFIRTITEQAVVAGIRGSDLKELRIPYPPKQQQDGAVDILSCLDRKIENLRKQNETLEAIAQTLFKHWFVDFEFPNADGKPYKSSGGAMEPSELGDIPAGWCASTLGNEFDIAIGRTPPRKESEWFSTNATDIKWVSIKDMGSCGTYIFKTSEYLTREAVDQFNIPVIPANTVILSFKLTVGRVAITPEEMLSNEAIAHIKTSSDSIPSEYVYLFLSQFNFGKLGNTSSIATAVNSKSIKALEIIAPDSGIISKFYATVKPLFEKLKVNSQQIQTLTKTRDVLLPKLMSGKLRIKD
jgi:type I restriction enzyme S subunit